MKKLLYLFSASLLLFTSCSSNDNDSSDTETVILPKTIKYTSPISPAGNYTFTLVYNGNKIMSMDNKNTRIEYTYDGNVIIKESGYNYDYVSGNVMGVMKVYETTYTYANNKLSTAIISGCYLGGCKSKIVYTYNSDGTVTRDLYTIDITTGAETLQSERQQIITLVNGNVVKSVSSYGSSVTTTDEYIYDSKNSPFKNILGFNLLLSAGYSTSFLSWNPNSMNNVTKYTSTSLGTPYTCKIDYIYNADSYPTKKTTYQSDGTTSGGIIEYTY